MEQRATPEEMLRKIRLESGNGEKGHLKIFFGYAAGVGKTYAMLKAAHNLKKNNVDVVVGYIEPHTRPQTMQLLEGLELLPKRQESYKNIILNEFDIDTALARKPQVILVDELAHTNAEFCRHNKRYQDVEELLNAGIDVYTTVNVQHIESLNDIVASITGVMVHERIPDHVFDNADQIKLVDIEPQELIERLNAGKIYKPEQAQKALGNFFSTENLIALREIALRRTADRVNKISEKAKMQQGGEYFTDEHILVCLSSSPSNAKIIRTAARMANAFHGGFTALFVETSDFGYMSDDNKNRLRKNIHLAQQLGATIETTYGDDVALQIAEFARISSISKIVMGRTNIKRKFIFGKPSLTEKLTTYAPNLDIYIIPEKSDTQFRAKKIKMLKMPKGKVLASDILKSVGILTAATVLGSVFAYLGFSEANIITVYILGVLLTAIVTTSRAYSIASSLVSIIIFNFLFTDPCFTLQSYDSGYPVTFLITFLAALITGSLATKIKRQAKQAAITAYRTKILLETSQLLQQEKEQKGIVAVTANQLIKLLNKNVVFYMATDAGLSAPQIFKPENSDIENEADIISPNERAVANWVYKNNKHAGTNTGTLGNAKCHYLAVRASGKVYGVVGIHLQNDKIDSFDESILLSIVGECGIALEKDYVSRQREEAAAMAKNEQLRANLLRSISHDLRTPLTSISGNAGILLSNAAAISDERKEKLYTDIYDDSLWLINLVENLLSVTRIEDGTMNLNIHAELVDEIISEAMLHINRKSAEHNIKIIQENDIILAKVDARLIVQVIINIIDNAIKYTPVGSDIIITAKKEEKNVIIEVADNGSGIPDEDKPKIFEMFYTVNNSVADSRRSMGLGLALCKSIVNAHGGEISVKNNVPHGTVIQITLPSEEVAAYE